MTKTIYTLSKEPEGILYKTLLENLIKFCDTAAFVIQEEEELSNKALKFLNKISNTVVEKKRVISWPGTKLIGVELDEGALFYKIVFNENSCEIFKEETEGLFDWIEPNMPEDLSFLRPDGTEFFISISHEKDCYFKITEEEKGKLEKSFHGSIHLLAQK